MTDAVNGEASVDFFFFSVVARDSACRAGKMGRPRDICPHLDYSSKSSTTELKPHTHAQSHKHACAHSSAEA